MKALNYITYLLVGVATAEIIFIIAHTNAYYFVP